FTQQTRHMGGTELLTAGAGGRSSGVRRHGTYCPSATERRCECLSGAACNGTGTNICPKPPSPSLPRLLTISHRQCPKHHAIVTPADMSYQPLLVRESDLTLLDRSFVFGDEVKRKQ